MINKKPEPILLKDYQPPHYLVDDIDLTFVLGEKETIVTATSAFRKNPVVDDPEPHLFLNGEQLELVDLYLNAEKLSASQYRLTDDGLLLKEVPQVFTIELTTRLNPAANLALSGLYLSSGNFCTQCEAEGFRRITYYPDRPDILARFKTRIEAHSATFPVLLSNGNLVNSGSGADGYHFVEWHDPFPKPSYLFALVAGNFVCQHDTFTTKSGREITLEIYLQPQHKGQSAHAMRSLKKAMAWDEQVFGLEYDLDRFMIVAVDDFNMGAMENKGLNIFNSKYIMASPETATDQDYLNIEGVVAHEYFHNWTGNRVTCRDWFQLSLKEGLTVFRDQEFSADMNSRPAQRIDDVKLLRHYQFREDAGPMAHPVRPERYMEINNFYTVTVYNKGAEVVRMMHTLLGAQLFRSGMDLYFQRHDGQAVTCDDFIAAMSDASAIDLGQFKRWYSQAGTPEITVSEQWHQQDGSYQLQFEQHTPKTPGQKEKKAFHIPILFGLIDQNGQELEVATPPHCSKRGNNLLFELKEQKSTVRFTNLSARPVPSVLRNFSAPVKLKIDFDISILSHLMSYDSNLFSRWNVSFALGEQVILAVKDALSCQQPPVIDERFFASYQHNLTGNIEDAALTALAITLPQEEYLAQLGADVDPELLHQAYTLTVKQLSNRLYDEFKSVYLQYSRRQSVSLTPEAMGARSLATICLYYLSLAENNSDEKRAILSDHYNRSDNMTNVMAALAAVCNLMIPLRDELLQNFERKWSDNPLVMDKWLAIQAGAQTEDTFERVKKLLDHPTFSMKNPNKVRALIGAFCANHHQFHRADGAGYYFLTEKIVELDSFNPQIAARLVSPLTSWRNYLPGLQKQMKQALEALLGTDHLSKDVYEIVQKSLQGAG